MAKNIKERILVTIHSKGDRMRSTTHYIEAKDEDDRIKLMKEWVDTVKKSMEDMTFTGTFSVLRPELMTTRITFETWSEKQNKRVTKSFTAYGLNVVDKVQELTESKE